MYKHFNNLVYKYVLIDLKIHFIGSYIKIKNRKWAVAVEGYLGTGILSSFAVDNNKDNQLLRQIFNNVWKNGRQPQIITSKFVFQVISVDSNQLQFCRLNLFAET